MEFTKAGKFIRQFNVDAGQGGAFGIAVARIAAGAGRFNFAAVDDVSNSISVYALPIGEDEREGMQGMQGNQDER